jgi:NAD(P)-dependent dehydrogenase (short-subunit alcohol dehydrogenase family)
VTVGSLTGKVAFISGGARGMGAAEAKLFVQEGAAVAIADILDERGRALAADIERGGGRAMYVHVDVAVEADWTGAATAVREKFGRIDVLVNNAGINDRQTIMGTSAESWRKVMAVNVDGTLFGLRAIAPVMRDGGGGAVVNIASTAGFSGNSFAAYATSKWAVRGLTRCAALEFAPWNIRVNAICPGLVLTELNTGQPYIEPLSKATPLGRAGTVDDIARLALFLVSDASAYITGQDHVIDGGFTAGLVLPSTPG